MLDFITLKCPSCGGNLRIDKDLERFVCGYCGSEHIVRRSGGTVSLIPIVESLSQIKTGIDKTASELAIKRLVVEIPALENQKTEKINAFHQHEMQILMAESELKESKKASINALLGFIVFVALTMPYVLSFNWASMSKNQHELQTMLDSGNIFAVILLGTACFAPAFAIGAVVQFVNFISKTHQSTQMEEKLTALQKETPHLKKELDRQIQVITDEISQKKKELSVHQRNVSL